MGPMGDGYRDWKRDEEMCSLLLSFEQVTIVLFCSELGVHVGFCSLTCLLRGQKQQKVYPSSFVHSMSIVCNTMNTFWKFGDLLITKKYLSEPQNSIPNGHLLGFGNIFTAKTVVTDILQRFSLHKSSYLNSFCLEYLLICLTFIF